MSRNSAASNQPGVTVRRVDFADPAEREALYDLRYRVLREPLNLPRGSERIAQDPEPETYHIGAFIEDAALIGCATLIPNAGLQLRAMAVDPDWRGGGIGIAVVRAAAEVAAGRPLWCEARLHAVGFYAKAGWSVEGEAFDVPGIGPHHRMCRTEARPGGSHNHLFEAIGGADGCRRLVNAFPLASPEPTTSVTPPADAPQDIASDAAWRWGRQRAIEDLVRSVHGGDAERALTLLDGPLVASAVHEDRSAWMSLLALLGAHGSPDLLACVERALDADPALVTGRYTYGRTLLHDAAAAWAPEFAALLLARGADPNAVDNAGHTALYEAADHLQNGRRPPEDGAAVVRLLSDSGACPDTPCGVRRGTALHVAARRDNAAIAAALLDLGAAPGLPDRLGDTPLRRAVSCGQPEVAALLLAHGADRHSVGSGDGPWHGPPAANG